MCVLDSAIRKYSSRLLTVGQSSQTRAVQSLSFHCVPSLVSYIKNTQLKHVAPPTKTCLTGLSMEATFERTILGVKFVQMLRTL